MNSTKTRIAAAAATGAALGLGMFMAQSATAVAAPAQSTFPQVVSPESGLSPTRSTSGTVSAAQMHGPWSPATPPTRTSPRR